jgi:hypothetical protein
MITLTRALARLLSMLVSMVALQIPTLDKSPIHSLSHHNHSTARADEHSKL